MLDRQASKLKNSAEATQFLNPEMIFNEGDELRGRCIKKRDV